jgi:CubicO group peptidase (beta-lactamase class C family)
VCSLTLIVSSTSYILPPDQRPSYSNLGYALIGNTLAEKVVSPPVKFDAWVADHISAPLGLQGTGFYPTVAQQKQFATGYAAPNVPVPPLDLGWAGPAGQMFSSVGDLLTFLDIFAESWEPEFPNMPAVNVRGLAKNADTVLSAVSGMGEAFVTVLADSMIAH